MTWGSYIDYMARIQILYKANLHNGHLMFTENGGTPTFY